MDNRKLVSFLQMAITCVFIYDFYTQYPIIYISFFLSTLLFGKKYQEVETLLVYLENEEFHWFLFFLRIQRINWNAMFSSWGSWTSTRDEWAGKKKSWSGQNIYFLVLFYILLLYDGCNSILPFGLSKP